MTAPPMAPGQMLPHLDLHDVRTGRPMPVRAPQLGSLVLFVLHGPDCQGCREYLRTLEESREACRIWGGRPVAVAPGTEEEALALADEVGRAVSRPRIVADPDGRIRGRLSMEEGAALLIADRFGECFHAAAAEEDHAGLPDADEIEEWLRYLGTQCPECGVPDTARTTGPVL